MTALWIALGALALTSAAIVLWDWLRYPTDATEVDKDDERFGRSI